MVDALERIRAALLDGGVLVDTQPVGARPAVLASGRHLGVLDMTEWSRTVEAIDALLLQTIENGLYSVEDQRSVTVTDGWDSGSECLETVYGWQGTRVPDELEKRLASVQSPVTVDQEVRLRALRAT